jgi:putative pyrroloquinoline-quinone binding quinoprotein
MDVNGGVVVIDLGYERGEPPSYGSRGRDTSPAWLPVAFLSVLVLLMAGASAGPAKSPLDTVFSLSVGPADAFALTDDGTLLAQTYGLLTSYDLDDGRIRWQAGQSTPAYRLRLGEGLVLMRPWAIGSTEPGTTAVSIGNGSPQWERPGNVVTVAGSSTLLSVSSVRSLSGNGRRVQGPIEAVDPVTGTTRWTVQVPNTAVLLGVPGAADEGSRMLLMHDDRTLAIHDLDTGQRLASTQVPAADYSPDNPTVAGGMILLRHPGQWGAELSAYDPVTLRLHWTAQAENVFEVDPCGALACLSGPGGVRAVDPETGLIRWNRPSWGSVEPFGTSYVAYRSADRIEPVTVFDPDDGAVEVDLRGWRPVPAVGAIGHQLFTRATETGGRTMVAVAQPGKRSPSPLAALPAGVGDCQAVPERLICRSSFGELVVWAYREG